MDQLNEYLQTLITTSSQELRLEPNKIPYVVSANGSANVADNALLGTQISMMVFPLIPQDVKLKLPNEKQVEFIHPHNLGHFTFTVTKSSAGFNVTVRPSGVDPSVVKTQPQPVELPAQPFDEKVSKPSSIEPEIIPDERPSYTFDPVVVSEMAPAVKSEVVKNTVSQPTILEDVLFDEAFSDPDVFKPSAKNFEPEVFTPEEDIVIDLPNVDPPRNDDASHPSKNPGTSRMDALFNRMAEVGASDLHLSVSMPPMVRKDGKIQKLECAESTLSAELMKELLTSIMPAKNQEEFERRNDTDFAYEIAGLARFRCNVFMDRKGMGAVFRIIPTKMTTAEQLGLSQAILGLCDLSKGLVVVTGPTGSGKSTTLCAMVNHINQKRDDHIITIEDPIEFIHDNIKCLVNQREVHNHTDSFKDALRAALREDPDILLVGEMRDLETISIAIETAETGHLVFGTLHTTTAASTVDRIIDQFPADRQQQIRVMLSESLKGVIAQTLLPKKGGGRVAALEILIVTPAISNLIREGKTFQIPSAMQTGKNHGMVMLNDALFELVKNGTVEPRDAFIKAVDKTGFETMLTRGGFKM